MARRRHIRHTQRKHPSKIIKPDFILLDQFSVADIRKREALVSQFLKYHLILIVLEIDLIFLKAT